MAATDTWFSHVDKNRRASIWAWPSGGGDLGAWNSDGKGNVTFKNNDNTVGGTEHWRTWRDWLICTGFSPPPGEGDWPTEPKYSGRIIKATVTDLNTGAMFDLPPLEGAVHYYAPALLWRDPIKVENHVLIDGAVQMFWACMLWGSRRFTNPCTGEVIPDGIIEEEVWWDATDGWVRGSGTPPFDAQGNPLPVKWKSIFQVGLAPGIGVVYGKDLPSGKQWGCRAHWTF